MIDICLIGVSGFAGAHYTELTQGHTAGLCRLVAATVINQDEEVERCAHLTSIGCRLHTDFREMLAAWGGKAQLCVVPTGIHWHAPMAIAALEAGMHVLLEKPAAATLAEVRAMQDAERRTGLRVFMGFQSLYASETLQMKRAALDGSLGPIREIVAWAQWPRNAAYFTRNAWAGKLQVNGTPVLDSPINNAVAHQVQMILFLAGADEARAATITQVQAELYRAKPIESCDTAALAITTVEAVPCRFLVTHACANTINPTIEIRGERGTLRWDFHRRVTIRSADGRERGWAADAHCRPRMHAAVREAILGGNAFVARLDHAWAHTQVVNLAHAAGPITTIDAAHVNTDGSVRGLDEAMTAAVATPGTLLHGHGAAWTVPARLRAAHPEPTVAEMIPGIAAKR